MKNIYINKRFQSSGFALFLNKEDADEDESIDNPYVMSKEYEISDDDYDKLKYNINNQKSIFDILEKYDNIRL